MGVPTLNPETLSPNNSILTDIIPPPSQAGSKKEIPIDTELTLLKSLSIKED